MNKVCKNCGEVNSASSLYCANCNQSLSDSPAKQEYTPTEYADSMVYDNRDEIVSIGTWILIYILLVIPIVSLISTIIMAFVVDNENIRNFGKASLIMLGVGLVLLLLFRGCSF